MGDIEHKSILERGVEVWNRWRKDRPAVKPDLSGMTLQAVAPRGLDAVSVRGVDLREFDLRNADLSNSNLWMAQLQSANLSAANLQGAVLHEAVLTGATLQEAFLYSADLRHASLVSADLSRANLSNADLSESDLTKAKLVQATLEHTNLQEATLREANLMDARCHLTDFRGATLQGANLFCAKLVMCDLSEGEMKAADFRQATCVRSSFAYANAQDAKFDDADLTMAIFLGADLTRAKLHGASLEGALLIGTDFKGAELWEAKTYGASVWNIVTDENTVQRDLPIRSPDISDDPAMFVVDDIEVAQFLQLLRDHKKLGKIINALTDRLVLLLGPFKNGGKERLREAQAMLRSTKLNIQEYWPVIFDFGQPHDRDLEEAVRLMVGLSRFVVADVGGPSVGHELAATVKAFHVPFAPIIQEHKKPYSLFSSLKREPHVLSLVKYRDTEDLLCKLSEIVRRAEEERARLRAQLENG